MTTEKKVLKVENEYEAVAEQLERDAEIKAGAALEMGGWTGMALMVKADALRLQAQHLRQKRTTGANMKRRNNGSQNRR